ncbi:heavy-metal-associated domain-containing protein [Rhodococcus qingshengii]|uniref:heavy-metal-associated domain-containing protein n=2 Tax=Rhodococcus TaxID=1827 RepID=UPI002108D7E1|nr:heavy metal-associated domain-containing protein [Rhodococcus qingshengii]MCQ4150442.1 heavy-metal-associated domain-containing protein [Rhodococcus qingshengii]
MSGQTHSQPNLLDKTQRGCGCNSTKKPPTTSAPTTTEDIMSATNNTFAVTGLTCGHCVGAVTDELRALPGVSEVDIDLVAGGVSTVTVTASAPLTEEQVTAALDEAGNYHLANI